MSSIQLGVIFERGVNSAPRFNIPKSCSINLENLSCGIKSVVLRQGAWYPPSHQRGDGGGLHAGILRLRGGDYITSGGGTVSFIIL